MTIQVPPGPETSSRPGAGSEESSVWACWTPTALRNEWTTERPGGLSTAATAAATSAPATSGRACRRGQATGSRSAYARRTTAQARSSAARSPGASNFTPAAP
ncbi:MAG: hypothetical protein E6F97_08665 [Actinobacteria bacterium]|nr:MAG: hypothetical protein E6F97_08665 [Actinomycetota bacterium]